MAKHSSKSVLTIGMLALLLSLPALGATINKSINIEADGKSRGATSVNGNISVGANATVTGNMKTVNGNVRVAEGARIEAVSTVNGGISLASDVKAQSLTTVNGSLRVGEKSAVDGDIEAVNGSIGLAKGTDVSENVGNVNGQIELSGAAVSGNLSTVSGDIYLVDKSTVTGNILVEEPSGWGSSEKKGRKPRIVIGPGSTVVGMVELEREVDLFISPDATVGGVKGVMALSDAVRFSGERP